MDYIWQFAGSIDLWTNSWTVHRAPNAWSWTLRSWEPERVHYCGKPCWPSFQLAQTPPLLFLCQLPLTSAPFQVFHWSKYWLTNAIAGDQGYDDCNHEIQNSCRKFQHTPHMNNVHWTMKNYSECSLFLVGTSCWEAPCIYTTQKDGLRSALPLYQLKPCTAVNTANGHLNTISLFPNKLGWNWWSQRNSHQERKESKFIAYFLFTVISKQLVNQVNCL